MLNISTSVFKKLFPMSLPKCPMNPNHVLSTNFKGEWVCTSCSKQIKELKKEVRQCR